MLHIKVYHEMDLLEEYNDYIISGWKLILIAKKYNVKLENLRVDVLRM